MAEMNRRGGDPYRFALIVVLIVAVGLRVFGLTAWSLDGDEMNTLRDSLNFRGLGTPKPLLFLLNHYLLGPWLELDELGLRLLPALFGILAIPVVYWLGKQVLGPRAGLLAAVLVTFSPWHVYWSQYGRYYSLVFLLSAVFAIFVYRGVRERKLSLVFTGIGAEALAILAHPSAGLLLAGIGLWFLFDVRVGLATLFRRHRFTRAVGLVIPAAVVAIVGYRLVDVLFDWYNLKQDWGHQGITLVLSYLGWLVPAVVVFSVAGLIWLWREGQGSLAALLALGTVAPVVILAPLSFLVPVSTAYLFATAPLVFLAAGHFLDRVADAGPRVWGRSIVMPACLLALLAADSPRLLSHYIDGGRLDYRAAALHLQRHASPDATILADQVDVMSFYLPGRSVSTFSRQVDHLTQTIGRARGAAGRAEVWLVVEIRRRGGFYELGLDATSGWIESRCRLSASFGRPRLDYKYNELRVYRCSDSREAGGSFQGP